MNHLTLLIAALVVVVAGILLFVGQGDEDEEQIAPNPTPEKTPPHPNAEDATHSPTEPEVLEPPPEARRPDGTHVDLEQKLVEYVAEDVTLAEAFEELGRKVGCDVSFSDQAWDRVSSGTLTLHLQDVGVPTVLNFLTEPYGVVYRVHGGVLWILMPGEEPAEEAR